MPDEDIHYIECDCHDLDHISRIWFDQEYKLFEIEYKLVRFPYEYGQHPTYTETPEDTFWSKLWKKTKFRYECFCLYFRNIFYAIKGRPIYFTSHASIGREEINRLLIFIMDKINFRNVEVRNLVKYLEDKYDLPKTSKYEFMNGN